MELGVEPVQSRANIVHFAEAVVVRALAHSRSAKIETQYRKAEAVQGLHGVKDDLVMERPAVQGMGMANQSGVSRPLRCPG